MGLYEVPLSVSLLGFGMGTMLANFHMCGIMLVLRAVFNMLLRNASPRRPMCFRCLIFSLAGPCEFFNYFVLLPLRPDLWSMQCYILAFYVLLCLSCVFDSVSELFGETIRNMCVIVIECYGSVGGGSLLDRPCMVFQRMCVLCM